MAAAETFQERLRRLRTDAGLKPGDLAYRAGVTENAIRAMESGQTKMPSFPVGARVARALGVDAYYLAFGEGPAAMDLVGEEAANGGVEAPQEASMEARIAGLEDRQARSIETVAQLFGHHQELFLLLARFLVERGVLTPLELEQIQQRLKTGG